MEAETASTATDKETQDGSLVLTVYCPKTRPGEVVAVFGDGPHLGCWGLEGAPPLLCKCIHDDGSSTWPQWVLDVPLHVKVGQVLEYKYLIVREDALGRANPRWETARFRENRIVSVDAAVLQTGVHDDGEFGRIAGRGPKIQHQVTPVCEQEMAESKEERRRLRQEERAKRDLEKAAKLTEDNVEGEKRTDEDRSALPPVQRVRKLGKGKQGQCHLVEVADDGGRAVLKEFKGGDKRAFQAEVDALTCLSNSWAAARGIIPRFHGVAQGRRQVLMGYFPGSIIPDADIAPAIRGPSAKLSLAFRAWFDVADAVQCANEMGIFHCDVNPWNILISDVAMLHAAEGLTQELSEPAACLVDWACARGPGTAGRGTHFGRRGDFQPAELMDKHIDARTDVYGCAAVLLWLLIRRTRKGVGPDIRAAFDACWKDDAEVTPRSNAVRLELATIELAQTCAWGMQESHAERCPDVRSLRARVSSICSRHGLVQPRKLARDAQSARLEGDFSSSIQGA